MRVCIVSLNSLPALAERYKDYATGGSEVQLTQLARALVRQGHEVSLVVADLGQADGAVFEGVRTLKAFAPSAGLPGLRFVYPRWTKLWSAMSRADAEVYFVSGAGMMLGLLAMFCRAKHRRLVFRAASDSDCDPSSLLVAHCRDRWLYEFGLRRTDSVLVQSVSQQSAMLSNYGVGSEVIRGLAELPFGGAAAQSKDVDVLWVANLRQVKRPDRFLELARAMPAYRFHMVGGPLSGAEQLYRQIESEARSLKNVTFHGRIAYVDVGRLFDRARVFVNTSELEGFPNTFLQAWVRGVPVVTTFDPDGMVARHSLGSAHRDLSGLVQGVRTLLESDEVYRLVKLNALAYMEQHFGEREVLGPYLRALKGA